MLYIGSQYHTIFKSIKVIELTGQRSSDILILKLYQSRVGVLQPTLVKGSGAKIPP